MSRKAEGRGSAGGAATISGLLRVRGGLLAVAIFSSASLLGNGSLAAQSEEQGTGSGGQRMMGVFLGRTASRQIWTGSLGSDRLKGISLGAFLEVETPLRLLTVRAEAGYSGRGTVVWDMDADPERQSEASIRSHNLSLPVHGLLKIDLGAVGGYLLVGPTVDFLLSSECSAEFCGFIREERTTVVNVVVGSGVFVGLPARLRAYFEVRLTEGIGESYLGEFASARNRTVEALVRLGKPF